MKKYKKRIADRILNRKLRAKGKVAQFARQNFSLFVMN